MVVTNMFDRNLRLEGIRRNIERIREKKIVILGDYPHGLYLVLNLSLLGFRKFYIFGNSYGEDIVLLRRYRGYMSSFIESLLERIKYLSGEDIKWKIFKVVPNVDIIKGRLEHILDDDTIFLDVSEEENNLSFLENYEERTFVGTSNRQGYYIFRPSFYNRMYYKRLIYNTLFSIPLTSHLSNILLYKIISDTYEFEHVSFPPSSLRVDIMEGTSPLDLSLGLVGIGGGGTFALLQLLELHKLNYIRIKKIVIYDPKKVKGSNLNRQVLYLSEREIGRPKVEVVYKKIKKVFDDINVFTYSKEFYYSWDENSIPEGFEDVDLIVDAADNKKATRSIHEFLIYRNLEGYVVGSAGRVFELFGSVYTYFPRESLCFECSMDVRREHLNTQIDFSSDSEGCGANTLVDSASPSVISSNALAGSLSVIIPVLYLLNYLYPPISELSFDGFGFTIGKSGSCSPEKHYKVW